MDKFTVVDWFMISVTSYGITTSVTSGNFLTGLIIYWIWDYYMFSRINYK